MYSHRKLDDTNSYFLTYILALSFIIKLTSSLLHICSFTPQDNAIFIQINYILPLYLSFIYKQGIYFSLISFVNWYSY